MELFKASKQWAVRPADERFWSLEEMYGACEAYKQSAQEARIKLADLRVQADNGEMYAIGKRNIPARLVNWSFGQLCQRAGAPPAYLRQLPATLAAQNLNHGLAEAQDDAEGAILFHKNGDFVLRSINGPAYARVWNADIIRRLLPLQADGWRTPPARPAGVAGERTRVATAADVLQNSVRNLPGLAIREGDTIAPAGLYASDHDLFAFLVNENALVDAGGGHALARGFFVWNSEVGAASFGVTAFLYDAICGNHIVWGAQGVHEIRIRHVGAAPHKAFGALRAELIKYSSASASDEEAKIKSARAFEFGADKESAVTAALAYATRTRTAVTRKALSEAYDIAERVERYGAPGSAWGLANGLTELSQDTPHADARLALDRAAGKIIEAAF